VRRYIVEGEPGIFPAPVARVLQAIGDLFRGRSGRDPDRGPDPPAGEGDAPPGDQPPPGDRPPPSRSS
jgi:hypothetical protein